MTVGQRAGNRWKEGEEKRGRGRKRTEGTHVVEKEIEQRDKNESTEVERQER